MPTEQPTDPIIVTLTLSVAEAKAFLDYVSMRIAIGGFLPNLNISNKIIVRFVKELAAAMTEGEACGKKSKRCCGV